MQRTWNSLAHLTAERASESTYVVLRLQPVHNMSENPMNRRSHRRIRKPGRVKSVSFRRRPPSTEPVRTSAIGGRLADINSLSMPQSTQPPPRGAVWCQVDEARPAHPRIANPRRGTTRPFAAVRPISSSAASTSPPAPGGAFAPVDLASDFESGVAFLVGWAGVRAGDWDGWLTAGSAVEFCRVGDRQPVFQLQNPGSRPFPGPLQAN